MKKYNLSKIMKRAWELVKRLGFGISEALKKAWKEAKILQTWEDLQNKADEYCANNRSRWTVSHWEKYGYNRYYINIWKNGRKYGHAAGYWDENKQKYVAPEKGIDLFAI